jgi:preprotein translocase subunit SecA
MHSVRVPAPGVVHGVYPQRRPPEVTWLEQRVTSWAGYLRRCARAGGASEKHMAQRVNTLAREFRLMADEEIRGRAEQLRSRLRCDGFQEELVATTFALVREVAGRTLEMRHYDAQIIAGWLMLQGKVVELETGAGKTLTATLPACTAALAGIPVHIVTVNDYLVSRDARWMQPLYRALGISSGTILEGMVPSLRQHAYRCDIAYTTNKQLVFDYLKDRLTLGKLTSPLQLQLERLHGEESNVKQLLLRGLCFAIVDEADSVLIDESRTPLIISKDRGGLDEEMIYHQALQLAEDLELGRDFSLIEKFRTVELTEFGKARICELASAFGGVWRGYRRGLDLVLQALNAKHAYIRDKHYLIKDDRVQIVDEFTGRTLADRSWERGLHQMIEAKEGCVISGQKETLARISYQQFFRRYLHLAGMTGTAREVTQELWSVYHLQVASVRTHWTTKREQFPTLISKTACEKWQKVCARIAAVHRQGRPVLIGTRSVAMSEHLSRLLDEIGLVHQVLNARQDEDEAAVIKTAGDVGRIVVATNMAGRGTDIKLGPGVVELGGLHVIATEIHEAKRIDRQLFGRCARQGDPGSFEMILSLDDELVRLYCPWMLKPLHSGLKRAGSAKSAHWSRWSWFVIRLAQKGAEREHWRQRYSMLKLDDRLKATLAFSGSSE